MSDANPYDRTNSRVVPSAPMLLSEARIRIKWLERELAEARAALGKWQEREAAVCPEDYGFEEVITSLRKQLARAVAQEREECAKIAESIDWQWAHLVPKAIRERGK